MTTKQLKALDSDISLAITDALKAITGLDDSGTCNFDSVEIELGRVNRTTLQGLKNKLRQDWRCKAWYTIATPIVGQGQRNTRLVELVAEELRTKGYKAYVRYVMD